MSQSDDTISALLPVHAAVNPAHLSAAIDSLLAQTHLPEEIVVVEDGPLPSEQLELLAGLEQQHPRVVRIALPCNYGAGIANQEGLLAATGTWIAKVDADDVSIPERFALQVCALAASGADVCGGVMIEFEGDIDHPTATRSCRLSHDEIARRMKLNNPINHPTSMYRRRLAVEAGGYPDFRYMQDYVLFARMLSLGARMMNVDQPLVYFRAGEQLHARRRDPAYTRLEWRLQQELHANGVIGRGRMPANFLVRVGYRRLPEKLMRLIHRRVLAAPVEIRSGDAS